MGKHGDVSACQHSTYGARPGPECKTYALEGAQGEQDYKGDPENDAHQPI